MRDATRVLFFDIAGKTGVELSKVEGAYGLGRKALNQGIRPAFSRMRDTARQARPLSPFGAQTESNIVKVGQIRRR